MSDPLTEPAAKAYRAERRRGNGLKPPEPPPALPPPLSEEDMERRIVELSKLGALRYALERAAAAKAMKIPAGMLDRLVKGQRPAEEEAGQGRAISFPPVEPWPDAVDGVELLDKLAADARRYVVMSVHQADTLALWIVHTFALDAFIVSPPARRQLGSLVLRQDDVVRLDRAAGIAPAESREYHTIGSLPNHRGGQADAVDRRGRRFPVRQ